MSDDGIRELRHLIDGAWMGSRAARGAGVQDPATGETLGTVPFASAKEVDGAVHAARRAFEGWRDRTVEERVQPLFAFKERLERRQDDLAELLVRDHGKTRAEAHGEIRRGIENVEVACGIPSLIQGGIVENAAPGIDEAAIRQPLGVFAAVTPFNFPAMIPLWFLPYAVATGNTFILKPSERTPLVPQALCEILQEIGLPDGVVQLLHGEASTVEALVDHDGVRGISLVGSTPVARQVYAQAAANGKRVQAQGGAKNHVVVTSSADLGYAAEKTLSSALACTGQRCLANDVALVEESVQEAFIDRILALAHDTRVGSGLDEGTDIGPLISRDHADRVRDRIGEAVADGAALLRDGREVDVPGYDAAAFQGPTVLGDLPAASPVAEEEIFGPVLGIAPVPDLDVAIDRLNASRYGNAASLFTSAGADARRFRRRARVGNVGVNVGTAAPMAFFHFGGCKDSFFGDLHAQGEDMIHFYTDKTIYIERWPGPGEGSTT